MSEFLPDAPPSSPAPAAPPDPAGIPELVDLGQRLRRAREGRGIGVAELADRLHLAPEQLIALESGDRLHLHEPVFVIAQAKRVAQALGVDVHEQVERLRHSRLMQGPTALAATAAATAAPVGHDAAGPSRWGLAAAVAGLTLLLGVLVAQGIRQWVPERSGPPGQAASDQARRSGVTKRANGANGAKESTSAAAASPGVLLLRSDEPSWVEVRDADGQTLFSGLLEKEARFRMGTGLRVLAGRPDLVTASVGGAAPRRLGTISAVEWMEFPAP